jgi:ABC-2 type transport system permease protein
MKALRKLYAVIKKEFRQLRRDRITFFMIVGVPIGQILLFGYAINTDVRNLRSAVADQANSHLSRQFVAELRQTQVIDLQFTVDTPEQIEVLLRVVDTQRANQRAGKRAAAQLLVDGGDPTILGVANQLALMPFRVDSQPVTSRGRTFEVRPFYNPERRTAVNIIPGLIGVILTMTMTLFTAVAIVRERERGNLEFLINTPVSTAELMIGKVSPYILIGLIQLALIVGVGQLLFKVPVHGSMLDLYLAASAFIVANLALGLFISTVSSTQFQAMQMTVFLLLPSILLSGFMFPFDGMPKFAQYLGELLPNTHFIRLTRGIMLRNASLADLGQELLVLGVFAVVALTAAILRFSRRLD